MTSVTSSTRIARRGAPRDWGLARLTMLALALGIGTGFGAVVFRDLIGLLHNLFFYGLPSVHYDANVFTAPSRWGPFVILAPVAGGLIVTFVVANFAPEAKGHGVPEVMDAIYYREGIIRPIVVLVKSLASAVAIGSGSSVGREGPIIQIGSALASTVGQLVRIPAGQRITLVAAGAGAGIAATFNTPIGGVMFAIELMLPEVSVATFLPVAISTGAATFVGRWFFGPAPAFLVPPMDPLTADPSAILILGLYAGLGCMTGVAAAGFVRGLHLFEDLFDKIPWQYLRHVLGMLCLGVLMLVLYRTLGQYYVDGVGYATIESILVGDTRLFWLLGLLFVCKLSATCLSLGSGSSGGIFSPSLFMGATLGGCFAASLIALGTATSHQRPRLRHGRNGRHGRGRHRRGDDRHHHDIRDDAGLWNRNADDPGGGNQRRCTADVVAREHLYAEARAAGAYHPKSATFKHVPGTSRPGGHGPGGAYPPGGYRF